MGVGRECSGLVLSVNIEELVYRVVFFLLFWEMLHRGDVMIIGFGLAYSMETI